MFGINTFISTTMPISVLSHLQFERRYYNELSEGSFKETNILQSQYFSRQFSSSFLDIFAIVNIYTSVTGKNC